MSVEAMAVVLHHSKAKGTAKLVLLGIANHAGDGGAWPAVSTLATYANVDERNVQRALEKLVGTGELRVDVQAGGLPEHDDYTRPNRYTVQVECPPWCDRTMAHRDTRKHAGRQLRLPVDKSPGDPVAKSSPGGESATPPGGDSATQTVHVTQPRGQDSASTTDRARELEQKPWTCELCGRGFTTAGAAHRHQRAEHPPRPANPPADELAKVREKLRTDTAQARARDRGEATP